MSDYFNVADIFGENVFNDTVMQERLPKKVYKKLHEVMDEGKELDLETADVIAHEMKEWARIAPRTDNRKWLSASRTILLLTDRSNRSENGILIKNPTNAPITANIRYFVR